MDEDGYRSARHESRHAAAARHFRWPIRRVSRAVHWAGLTEVEPQTSGDLRQRAIEACTILLMPFRADAKGCDEDLRLLTAILEASTMKMSTVWDTATKLERDPNFIRTRRAIEGALLTRPSLDAQEIAELLGSL